MFDGMLSMAVHVTMLSSDDLLYVGTYNGMTVYDGLSVKTYNYEMPNQPIRNLDTQHYFKVIFNS